MKGNDFYKTYQTTEWQRKKNSVLERDDYTCQICGSSSGIMQVHHITYKHCKGKAYNAPMGDLITLCEDCHAHDDGDHEHFFNGDYHIKAGEEKPTVFDNTLVYGVDFEEFRIGVIISAKYKYSNWRHIGFFTNINDELGAYFPFLLGLKDKDEIWFEDWHNSEDYSYIRPASLDEVQYYVDRVEKSITHTHLMPFIKPHYIGPAELCKCPTETWVVDVDRFEAEKSGEIKK